MERKNSNQKSKSQCKIKEVAKVGIVSATISSILFGACTVDSSWYNNQDNIYGDINLTKGKEDLLNIHELELSKTFEQYAAIIRLIMDDVMTNEAAAREFCDNPNAYIESRNFDNMISVSKFELYEKDKRLIMALADPQILDAARGRDFTNFITLCIQKGYFASVQEILSVDTINIRKFFKTEDDYQKYLEILQKVCPDNLLTRDPHLPDSFAVGAPVLAIGFGGIEIGIVVHMEAWIWGAQAHFTSIGAQNEPVMKLWYNENTRTVTKDEKFAFYDQVINRRIEEAVQLISENVSGINVDELRSFLIANFKKYYSYE